VGAGTEIALRAALQDAGWRDAEIIDAAAFADRFAVVSVTHRAADADCGGAVDLLAWERGLADAREALQVLRLEDALAGFVARELDVPCLANPPAQVDLLRLELGLATAHRYLSIERAGDTDSARVHRAEFEAAVDRAVAFGHGLAGPADVDPDVDRAWTRARADTETIGILVAGSGQARVDGRPLARGVLEAPVGGHLIQAVDGPTVVAASLVEASPSQDLLVWVDPGGQARWPADIEAAITALAAGQPNATTDPLLVAAATLAGHRSPVLLAALDGARVGLWAPVDAELRRLDADVALRGDRAGRSDWTLRLAAGGQGLTLDGAAGGVGAGLSMGADVDLGARWRVGGVFRPSAVPRRASAWEGAGLRWTATVPVLGSARLRLPAGAQTLAVGLDLGPHLLAVRDRPVGVLLLAAVELEGTTRRGPGWQVGAWAGPGTGYAVAGASVGVRGRP